MRSTLILFFILLSFSPSLCAQSRSKDTLIRYFDTRLEPVKKKDAVFVGVVIRDQIGWNCLIYDDSMRILLRGKYVDEDCRVKEGWFIYYYTSGKRASGGRYSRNMRVDSWKTWYPSGIVKDSFNFVNDAAEGPARSYYEDGRLAAEGNYKAGNFDGPWTWYHENGNIATKEVYKNGKLSELECFDTAGVSKGMNCAISRPPALVGRYGGLEKYFKDSMQIPTNDLKQPIEGFVTVEFNINKEGTMNSLRIIASTDPALSKESERVIRSIRAWYPAVSHNRVIDYNITINIPFFVNDPNRNIDIVTPQWDAPWEPE